MKKQIIYPKFIPRLLSTSIDFTILLLTLAPLAFLISRYVVYYIFLYWFPELFDEFSASLNYNTAGKELAYTIEFGPYTFPLAALHFLLVLNLMNCAVNIIFLGLYFVFFWHKFGATPGKMIMRMKIVNADDYLRPSLYRLIVRYCSYVTIPIGIFRMLMSENGQALHDRLANTLVIKS